MANTQAVAIQDQSQGAGAQFARDLEEYTPNLADALPSHIPVERFKRVLVTAVSSNPALLDANRRTLFNSAVKCAVDGLIPDGREAALVIYNTKVKQRDRASGVDKEIWIDAVQYMPMIAGIRKRLRNSGEVVSAVAEAVFEKDSFRYSLGDNAFIDHQPPALGVDRGPVIGAYAIIRLTNGEVIRDVMDRATIEKARHQGKAPNSLMWKDFYWEGAKKTVLRRASKQAPISADLERIFSRDDEEPAGLIGGDHHEQLADHREPEPQRTEPSGSPIIREDDRPQYAVVDSDGVESVFADAKRAVGAIRLMVENAAQLGLPQLDGLWESNQAALELLGATGFTEDVAALAVEYDEARQRLRTRPAAEAQPEQGQSQAGQNAPGTAAAPQTAPAEQQQQPADRPDNMTIPPVMKQGKPDWRTWAVALFLPKLRKQRDSTMLAYLLGDNEENLKWAQAPGTLSKDDLDELNAAINMQKRAVG